MENFYKNSNFIYYSISAVIAGITFAGLIYKGIFSLFKKIKSKYNHLEDIHEKVEKIFEELTPNHGSSIKDKINSLDKRMNKIDENLVKNNDLTEKIFYRQRWILDNQEAAVFESDAYGKCIWANVHYLKLIKRNMDFVLGNGWKNIIAPEDRERVTKNWEICVDDGIDSEDTYSIVDSEGKYYKVFCSATKTDNNGYIGSLKILE
jgi:hypothetical protein